MRFFIDTEFMEEPGFLELLSIGIVAENGQTLYAVNESADYSRANKFVRQLVLPHLDVATYGWNLQNIGPRALRFINGQWDGNHPEFWGYFADYDWVLFCWLQGTMMDLPKGWPMYCRDLRQEMDHYGISRNELPPDSANEHNALADARWTKAAWDRVNEIVKARV